MKYLFVIFLFIIPITSDFTIYHGDPQKTKTVYYKTNDYDYNVETSQEVNPSNSSRMSPDGQIIIFYRTPVVPSDKESVVWNSFLWAPDGKKYKFDYSTSKFTTREEEGHVAVDSNNVETLKVKGTFSYENPEGGAYIQGYTADENGFRTKVAFGTKLFAPGTSKPPTHPSGPSGYAGSQGTSGQSGQSGQFHPGYPSSSGTGYSGSAGTPGTPGRPGQYYPGSAGTPGTPGRPGIPGQPGQYYPGTPGRPGTPGQPGQYHPGTPGRPGTPGVPGGIAVTTSDTKDFDSPIIGCLIGGGC